MRPARVRSGAAAPPRQAVERLSRGRGACRRRSQCAGVQASGSGWFWRSTLRDARPSAAKPGPRVGYAAYAMLRRPLAARPWKVTRQHTRNCRHTAATCALMSCSEEQGGFRIQRAEHSSRSLVPGCQQLGCQSSRYDLLCRWQTVMLTCQEEDCKGCYHHGIRMLRSRASRAPCCPHVRYSMPLEAPSMS